MQKQQKKPEDLGIKIGSEEMVYWRNLIDAKELDLKTTKENLKFYEFILKNAKIEYEKAEKEFNEKSKSLNNSSN